LRPQGTHQIDVEAPCTAHTLCTLLLILDILVITIYRS
jgi:hypothetical protein